MIKKHNFIGLEADLMNNVMVHKNEKLKLFRLSCIKVKKKLLDIGV